jgi:DNA-binding XRE family transcriptional regulator
MTLQEYLERYEVRDDDFGDSIGVTRAAVTRFRNGTLRPSFATMVEICRKTRGRVSPNDFLPPAVHRLTLTVNNEDEWVA